MEKVYVAHDVIYVKGFRKSAYDHHFLGCEAVSGYVVSERLSLYTKSSEGYVKLNPNSFPYCRDALSVIELAKLNEKEEVDVVICNMCDKLEECRMRDYSMRIDSQYKVIGLADVYDIIDYTKADTIDDAIKMVSISNEKLSYYYSLKEYKDLMKNKEKKRVL